MRQHTKQQLLWLAMSCCVSCQNDEANDVNDVYCHYINPFTDTDECKAYSGPWETEQMEADCKEPLVGMADPGTLTQEACIDEGVQGTCTVELDQGRTGKLWFYAGSGDVLRSSCEGFLNGIYEDLDGTPSEWRRPMPEAISAMESNDLVIVDPECTEDDCIGDIVAQEKWIAFTPATFTSGKGFIFWPGGLVDPRAYAVVAKSIAEQGVLAILPIMPQEPNDQFAQIRQEQSEVTQWFLGGHSHGGAIAMRITKTDPTGIEGLILWASIAVEQYDLSDLQKGVLFFWGTNDGRNTPESVEEGKQYLPAATEYVKIDGANHSQFGHYIGGENDVDNPATISREEQQSQAIQATLDFMGVGP